MWRRDALLYAEDDESFADFLKCTLEQGHFTHRLIHVPDGEQAIAYLKGEGKYSDRHTHPLPGVVLLDLKMPRVDGFQVLKWIREQSPFPKLPVVVLTGSEEIRDLNRAYQLGATSFLIKPPNVADLQQMLQALEVHWLPPNSIGTSPIQDRAT